jgi:hypothetical protein
LALRPQGLPHSGDMPDALLALAASDKANLLGL